MSFSEARLTEGERRKSGTVTKPSAEAEMSLRRAKSMGFDFTGAPTSGKLIAAVGHTVAQV
jgi:hypothetical protein